MCALCSVYSVVSTKQAQLTLAEKFAPPRQKCENDVE